MWLKIISLLVITIFSYKGKQYEMCSLYSMNQKTFFLF